MIHTVRVLALAACTLLLAGCYTQLSMVQRAEAPPKQPCPEGRGDSCAQADSLAAASQGRTDTVVVRDDRSQTCYWTRNFWGDPVLRCYRSAYTSDWLSYYSDPWWNNRYGDGGGGYSSCPPYYYYDRYSGYCRNGHDYNNYWMPEGSHHNSGGSSSGSSRSSGAPHPRGYGVPGQPSQSGSGLPKTDGATYSPPKASAPADRSDDRPSVAPRSRSYGVPSAPPPPAPAPAPAAPKASEPQPIQPAGGAAMSGSAGGKQEGKAQGDEGKAGSSGTSTDRSQPAQKQDNPDNSKRKNPRSW
jgi:hypothetical protein